jgi:type IV pilus assembly protein PilA
MGKRRFTDRGFTLIELLIVIAILGIIAAAVIPNVAKFTQSGVKGAAGKELGSVQTAVYAAMADNGVETIAGGTINSTTDLSDYPIDDYLQGGIDRIKGTWIVDTYGLVTDGTFPEDNPVWTYEEAGDPQWSPYEAPP